MAILNQKTINKPINFEGITLHKGKYAKLKILPSSPNSGISFKRVDLTKNNVIFANFCNVSDATLCTTLSNEEGVSISTVEHLMAALYGMGVDNALIEIDQDEIPIISISVSSFIPVFDFTLFSINRISFNMSLKDAFPSLIKKLQCFCEIVASPKDVLNGTDFLINSQTFLVVWFSGFLNVLPPVLILDGCAISFFFFQKLYSFFN